MWGVYDLSMIEMPLLTISEAAKLLRVPPARLQRWAKQAIVPAILLPDGELRFFREDMEDWLREQRNGCLNKDTDSIRANR